MPETKTVAAWTRAALFKYYIHDGNDACKIQLTGELTEADLPELVGCWRTAQTTLKERKLIIDVRSLKSADDAGACWMRSMAAEGAGFLPDTFFPVDVFTPTGLANAQSKPNFFRKVGSLLRGLRVAGQGIS